MKTIFFFTQVEYSCNGRIKGRNDTVEYWMEAYFSFNSLTLAPTELSWFSSLFFLFSVFLRFLDKYAHKRQTLTLHISNDECIFLY